MGPPHCKTAIFGNEIEDSFYSHSVRNTYIQPCAFKNLKCLGNWSLSIISQTSH